jgi:hypothetical protein
MNQAIIDKAGPLQVKKGYNLEMEPQMVYPDKNGYITVETRELERLQIYFSDSFSRILDGFQVIGNRFAPLPIGSTLDRETGVFTWQPGAGFTGEYRLVFLVRDEYSRPTMKRVRVKIIPGN